MAAQCPLCAKPTAEAYRPFCSRRCADIDLQRWLVGRYAIPATRDEDADDTDPEGSSDPDRGTSGQGPSGRL